MASENGANVRSIATWVGIEHDQPRSLSSPDIRKSSQLRRQAVEVEGKAGEGKSKGPADPFQMQLLRRIRTLHRAVS